MKSTSKLSPARQALADAIARLEEAERTHAAALVAKAEASERRWAAEDALTAAREAAKAARPNAAAFAAGFVPGGATAEVAEIDRPTAEASAAVVAAEREAARWSAVNETLPGLVAERADDLDRARRTVEQCARAVIAVEGPAIVAAALDGFQALEDEIARRGAILFELDRLNAVAPEQKAAVQRTLRPRDLIPTRTGPYSSRPAGYDESAIVRAWSAALAALGDDAATPLPGAKP